MDLLYNNQKMSINQKSYSRIRWTVQEQNLLKQLREDKKMESWKMISKIINKTFKQKSRSGKQCRQRYTNYIKFSQNNQKTTDWTPEEDLLLFNSFVIYGPKWVKISKKIPGRQFQIQQRSQNCLKNRFYGAIRKLIRKIQKMQKQRNKKVRKNLKPESLIKYLQSSSDNLESQEGQSEQLLVEIRNKILELVICIDQTVQDQKIQQLILLQQKYSSLSKQNVKKSELNNFIDSQDKMEVQGEGTNEQGQKKNKKNERVKELCGQMKADGELKQSKIKITQNFIITLNNTELQEKQINNSLENRNFYLPFLYFNGVYNPLFNF